MAERSRKQPKRLRSPDDPWMRTLLVPRTGDGPERSYVVPTCPVLPPVDLDGDGLDERLVEVEVTDGGTSAWTRIWCIDPTPIGPTVVFDVTPRPPCPPPLRPKDSPKPAAVAMGPSGTITFAFTCLRPGDDQAGPGVEIRRSYRYRAGRLSPEPRP